MASYNLDTGKKYVKEIFSPESFYSIPDYQRPYVWGEDQIESLLNDISGAMNRDKQKEYFLGCMIWNTKHVQEDGIEYQKQDILDGQQRFISLYLLHGVLRDLSTDQRLKTKVDERMRQEQDEFDQIPERNRIVFDIRDDRDFLNTYLVPRGSTNQVEDIINYSKDKESSKSVRNIAFAIAYMRRWWTNLKHDNKWTEEEYQKYINGFFSYLSSKVLALYLATPDNLDDAYNLFTVLNSRGLQLQVSDIIRAQNLRLISNKEDRKVYARKWSAYEDSIGLPYKKFDDFLWAFVLIIQKYRSVSNKSLHDAFNFIWSQGLVEKGKDTFDTIGKYVEHYKILTTGNYHHPQVGALLANVNTILSSVYGNSYLMPLMHYRFLFGDYKIEEMFVKVDNLFSMMWFLGKKGIATRVFIILRKMEEALEKHGEREAAAAAFLAEGSLNYTYDDPKATTKLDPEEFYHMLYQEEFGAYSGTRVNKIRYLLLKLDLIRGDLTNVLQFNRYQSTVEHLMPQKIVQTDWLVAPDAHGHWLHRIGNLALLDRKKNSSLSNRLYQEKKTIYTGSIESRPHTTYLFMNYEKWGIEQIRENHEDCIGLLRRYYEGNTIETLMDIQKDLKMVHK